MSLKTRPKNVDWTIDTDVNGNSTTPYAQLAVLMDIREELQKLNAVFACPRFVAVPHLLGLIERNTKKAPVRKKKS